MATKKRKREECAAKAEAAKAEAAAAEAAAVAAAAQAASLVAAAEAAAAKPLLLRTMEMKQYLMLVGLTRYIFLFNLINSDIEISLVTTGLETG